MLTYSEPAASTDQTTEHAYTLTGDAPLVIPQALNKGNLETCPTTAKAASSWVPRRRGKELPCDDVGALTKALVRQCTLLPFMNAPHSTRIWPDVGGIKNINFPCQ